MLQAPFPWFGGKSKVASIVWQAFGNVPNYVEPFFGSGAVLLGRPSEPKIETVNDIDGYVSNFWRALQHDPGQVAHFADWPVNENDLHARHVWLVSQRGELQARLEGDPDFYDPKIAGYWVWGVCCWIGSGFCTGEGPWHMVDGKLVKTCPDRSGIKRQLPNIGNAGQGINRQLPSLNDAGKGINRPSQNLSQYFEALSGRLRKVRVCCGDWARIVGQSPTTQNGLTGVFLDPPYSAEAGRDNAIYRCESRNVAHDVREWCRRNGDNPKLRIALCGYEGEHDMPGWRCMHWKTPGGYGSQGEANGRENCHRERIWFTPHCLV